MSDCGCENEDSFLENDFSSCSPKGKSSKINSSTVQYDGDKLICTVEGITKFNIRSCSSLNSVLKTFAEQICLLNNNPTDNFYVSNVEYNELTNSLEFTGIGNAFAGTVDLTALKDDTNSFISNVELIDNELVFTATGVGPFSGAIDLASLVVAGGAVVSADNGLGIDPANNVQLGGTLFKNTNIGLSTFDFTLNTNLFSATGTTNGNIVGVGTANGYIDQVLNASTVNAAKFVVRTLGSKYGINHNNGIVELSSYIAEGELAAAHWGTTSNHSYYWITNNLIRGAINRNSGNFTLGNTNDLSARLAILGQSSTSSNFALKVQNSGGLEMLSVRNDGDFIVRNNVAARFQIWNTSGEFEYVYTADNYLYWNPAGGEPLTVYSGTATKTGHRAQRGVNYFEMLSNSSDSGELRHTNFFDIYVSGTTQAARFDSSGRLGIGTLTNPITSNLQVVGLPTYADNAAALAGGLTAGAMYIRTGHGLDIVV